MTSASITSSAGPLRLGLVGSPNAGKTTLFNALTGLRARVGNYPGVTVERREGALDLGGRAAVVIDLPGTYSLEPISADEAIVSQVIDDQVDQVAAPDALVIVADACSLERSLLLIGQVLARGRPTCLVLSMIDELRARGGELDRERLEAALGIPVVEVVGHRGLGRRGPDGLQEHRHGDGGAEGLGRDSRTVRAQAGEDGPCWRAAGGLSHFHA